MRGFDFNGAGEQANCFACVWDLKAGSVSDEARARLTAEAGSRKIAKQFISDQVPSPAQIEQRENRAGDGTSRRVNRDRPLRGR